MYSLFLFFGFLLGFAIGKIAKMPKKNNPSIKSIIPITPEKAFEFTEDENKKISNLILWINEQLRKKMQDSKSEISGVLFQEECEDKIINELKRQYEAAGWAVRFCYNPLSYWKNSFVFKPKEDFQNVRIEIEKEIEECLKSPTIKEAEEHLRQDRKLKKKT